MAPLGWRGGLGGAQGNWVLEGVDVAAACEEEEESQKRSAGRWRLPHHSGSAPRGRRHRTPPHRARCLGHVSVAAAADDWSSRGSAAGGGLWAVGRARLAPPQKADYDAPSASIPSHSQSCP